MELNQLYNQNLNDMPCNQDVIIAYTFNKANGRVFYTVMRKFQNTFLFQDDKTPDKKSGFRLLAFMLIPKYSLFE